MSARLSSRWLAAGLVLPLAGPAFSADTQTPVAQPPVAEKRPYDVVSPQGTRNDPYYWLRDDTRSKSDVLDYLKAENAYFEAIAGPEKPFADKLQKEFVSRLKQDDSTVPYKDRDYVYYTRFETGKEHPIYARKPAKGGAEEILVDANVEGAGKGFYTVGRRAISADQGLLAFAEDTTGRRQFTIRVRDIKTGKDYKDRIQGVRPGIVWANDNKTIFYVENDPVTLLSTRVKRHVLGTATSEDPVVYEEKDKSFYMGVTKSGDDRFIVIVLGSTVMSEDWVIDAANPTEAPRNFAPRTRDIHYQADHLGTRWVARTDWDAPNYRLMSVEDREIGDRSHWKMLIPQDPNVFIQGFLLFKDYLAVNERSNGLLRIRVLPWAAPEKGYYVASDESAYAEQFDANAEQDTGLLRYSHTSLATPEGIYELDMKTGKRTLLKRQPVLGGFKSEDYVTERLWAVARDGRKIPVSVVYKKGFKKDGTAPLYQYAYGSYGSSTDPDFDSQAISLLDRGFVYAIAHIRGGQELGRAWYDDGKLLHKKNTFTDFVDVTDYLVSERYAAKDKVFAMGASAGGLLMGAVANIAPEKYRGIIAHVPFVDAVTTMLDETIPLTSNEFDEWGNPKEKASYDYMLSYSPYDNVQAKAYPALLVTTGLYDSQVQYFEPAKWVAKLRATKTDRNPLLFKINMEAGHGGRSGRFERLGETATEYAFVLTLAGMSE
jgi:oligopeptidase B